MEGGHALRQLWQAPLGHPAERRRQLEPQARDAHRQAGVALLGRLRVSVQLRRMPVQVREADPPEADGVVRVAQDGVELVHVVRRRLVEVRDHAERARVRRVDLLEHLKDRVGLEVVAARGDDGDVDAVGVARLLLEQRAHLWYARHGDVARAKQ